MADRFGKTEPPSQRRLEKARREGQFLSANEFVAALQFLTLLALLGAGGAGWLAGFCATTRNLLARAFARDLSTGDLSAIAWQLFWRHMLPLGLAGLAVVVATVAIRL